jgi:hypothetical protein
MAEVGKVCLLPTEEMFSFSDLYALFFSPVFFFVAAVLFLVSFLLREFQTRWILELVLSNFLQLCFPFFSPCCCCCSSGALRFRDQSVRAFASA